MTRRGMTLLELIVAVALVAALFGALFTFLFDLLSARVRVLEQDGRQLAAVTLIESLESDLAACIASDPARGSGVRGDATTLSVLTRGTAAALADRGPDDPAVFCDLQRSEYRFDPATGRIEATRSAAVGPSAEPAGGAAQGEDLGGTVHKVRFRYHDGQGWVDLFDAIEAGRLPLAVEVAIWFEPPAGAAELPAPPAPETAGSPPRLTFDAEAGFDERAWAIESDLDASEPRPDRLRVIAVLDPAGGEDGEGPAAAEGTP